MRTDLVALFEMIMQLILNLPRLHLCNLLKKCFLELMGARIGQRPSIYPGVWITPGRNLVMGDDVNLAKDVIITTGGGVTIGNGTLVGYRSQILSANHAIPSRDLPIPPSGNELAPVVIGEGVWIGANCVITPGVNIGDGAVIGAGAIVTKNIPPYAIAAGVPARILRYRQ